MSKRKVECMAGAFMPGQASSYAMSENGEVYKWHPATITGAGFWQATQVGREFWPLVTEGMQVGYFYFDIEVKE